MNSNTDIYTPYTYLIGWSKLNKWYYGVRYATKNFCLYESGAHPNDLWKTYFTSSKHVKRFRELQGEPDIIQIRKTFNDRQSAEAWEKSLLNKIDAANNPSFLNEHNSAPGRFKHTTGVDHHAFGISRSDEVKKKISLSNKGKRRTPEQRKKYSEVKMGIPLSDEHKRNISKGSNKQGCINGGKTTLGCKRNANKVSYMGSIYESQKALALHLNITQNRVGTMIRKELVKRL